MRRTIFKALVAAVLLLLCVTPVLADNGADGRVLFGGSFTLEQGEVLDGDLVVFGGSVDLLEDSVVMGDVVVVGGSTSVGGRVEGDVAAIGGMLTLESTEVVEGDLVALGGVQREEGSKIWGEVIGREAWNFRELRRVWRLPRFRLFSEQVYPFSTYSEFWANRTFQFFRWLITTLGLVAIGVLLVLFIPKQADTVGEAMIQSPLVSLGFGLLTALVVVLLIPILIVICIGIPVAIVLFIAAALAVLYGWLVAGHLVGTRVKEAIRVREPSPLLDVVIGVPIISLLSAIPCLGPLFSFLVAMWGLGAVVLTRAGMMSYPSPEPPVPAEPEVTETPLLPAEEEEPQPPAEARQAMEEPQPPTRAEDAESEEEAPEE